MDVIEKSLRQALTSGRYKEFKPKTAATEWIELKKKMPKPGYSYLIRCVYAGPCYDVAFYKGLDKGGVHLWILSNVEIDHASITHYAYIRDPDCQED